MPIEFKKSGDKIMLIYSPENVEWLDHELNEKGYIRIRKVFYFKIRDRLDINHNENRVFFFANKQDEYYKIDKEKLNINHNIFIHEDINFDKKLFVAIRDISIFRRIDSLIDSEIYIGGNNATISKDSFEQLLREFPTSTELKLYSEHRISRVLSNELDIERDFYKKLQDNLNKRIHNIPKKDISYLRMEIELNKFNFLYNKMKDLLENASSMPEKEWQRNVLDIILLIFPKYIASLYNVCIKDFYTNSEKTTNRFIDITLIDFNGNIDIIEIKQPFQKSILANNPYRGNYIPHKELTGAIMQAEKYIFHLCKWGVNGEKILTKIYQKYLPNNLSIRITNPKALILLGRDDDFNIQQMLDFEIIRRKYSNIIDIMTYDDLLRRIKNIIDALKI